MLRRLTPSRDNTKSNKYWINPTHQWKTIWRWSWLRWASRPRITATTLTKLNPSTCSVLDRILLINPTPNKFLQSTNKLFLLNQMTITTMLPLLCPNKTNMVNSLTKLLTSKILPDFTSKNKNLPNSQLHNYQLNSTSPIEMHHFKQLHSSMPTNPKIINPPNKLLTWNPCPTSLHQQLLHPSNTASINNQNNFIPTNLSSPVPPDKTFMKPKSPATVVK